MKDLEITRGGMLVKLGKISKASFGIGGYRDVCIGLRIDLDGGSWACGFSKMAWDNNLIECDKNKEWTEEDRDKNYAEIVRYISDLLHQAKVDSIEDLKGIPIEAIFDGTKLLKWRILTEVI